MAKNKLEYLNDLAERFNCAPQVLQVLRLYAKVSKHSLYGEAPKICKELEDISIEIINTALSIYENKTERDHKAPHPNYFVVTCRQLAKDANNEDINPPIVGKLI